MELTLIPNNTPENVLNTNIVLGKISFDIDLVKNMVNGYLSKYEGLIVQEDDIKNIKTEIAFLRKQKKLIDKNRIKLSKEFDKPLVQYKEDCNSIMDLIENTIVYLNSQLNSFEEKRKEEKRQQVEFLIEKTKLIRHMPDDFEFIFEDRFLNATLSTKKIQEELLEQCNQYEIMIKLKKEMEEKIKAKKMLLEDMITKFNEQLDTSNKMRYTDYEYTIEEVELDELEKYMNEQFQNKLAKTKEVKLEKEKKKEIPDEIKNRKYLLEVYNITQEQLDKILDFVFPMNVPYVVKNINETKNELDIKFDICA